MASRVENGWARRPGHAVKPPTGRLKAAVRLDGHRFVPGGRVVKPDVASLDVDGRRPEFDDWLLAGVERDSGRGKGRVAVRPRRWGRDGRVDLANGAVSRNR